LTGITYEIVVDPKLKEPDGPTPLTIEKLASGVNALDEIPASEFCTHCAVNVMLAEPTE
jgi:hypothetical protein